MRVYMGRNIMRPLLPLSAVLMFCSAFFLGCAALSHVDAGKYPTVDNDPITNRARPTKVRAFLHSPKSMMPRQYLQEHGQLSGSRHSTRFASMDYAFFDHRDGTTVEMKYSAIMNKYLADEDQYRSLHCKQIFVRKDRLVMEVFTEASMTASIFDFNTLVSQQRLCSLCTCLYQIGASDSFKNKPSNSQLLRIKTVERMESKDSQGGIFLSISFTRESPIAAFAKSQFRFWTNSSVMLNGGLDTAEKFVMLGDQQWPGNGDTYGYGGNGVGFNWNYEVSSSDSFFHAKQNSIDLMDDSTAATCNDCYAYASAGVGLEFETNAHWYEAEIPCCLRYLKAWVSASTNNRLELSMHGKTDLSMTKTFMFNPKDGEPGFLDNFDVYKDDPPASPKLDSLSFSILDFPIIMDFFIPTFLVINLESSVSGSFYAMGFFSAGSTQGVAYVTPSCEMQGCFDAQQMADCSSSTSMWCPINQQWLDYGSAGPQWSFSDSSQLTVSLVPVLQVEVDSILNLYLLLNPSIQVDLDASSAGSLRTIHDSKRNALEKFTNDESFATVGSCKPLSTKAQSFARASLDVSLTLGAQVWVNVDISLLGWNLFSYTSPRWHLFSDSFSLFKDCVQITWLSNSQAPSTASGTFYGANPDGMNFGLGPGSALLLQRGTTVSSNKINAFLPLAARDPYLTGISDQTVRPSKQLVILTPHGTTLSKPATLTILHPGTCSSAKVMKQSTEYSGDWSEVSSSVFNAETDCKPFSSGTSEKYSQLTLSISSFSLYAPVSIIPAAPVASFTGAEGSDTLVSGIRSQVHCPNSILVNNPGSDSTMTISLCKGSSGVACAFSEDGISGSSKAIPVAASTSGLFTLTAFTESTSTGERSEALSVTLFMIPQAQTAEPQVSSTWSGLSWGWSQQSMLAPIPLNTASSGIALHVPASAGTPCVFYQLQENSQPSTPSISWASAWDASSNAGSTCDSLPVPSGWIPYSETSLPTPTSDSQWTLFAVARIPSNKPSPVSKFRFNFSSRPSKPSLTVQGCQRLSTASDGTMMCTYTPSSTTSPSSDWGVYLKVISGQSQPMSVQISKGNPGQGIPDPIEVSSSKLSVSPSSIEHNCETGTCLIPMSREIGNWQFKAAFSVDGQLFSPVSSIQISVTLHLLPPTILPNPSEVGFFKDQVNVQGICRWHSSTFEATITDSDTGNQLLSLSNQPCSTTTQSQGAFSKLVNVAGNFEVKLTESPSQMPNQPQMSDLSFQIKKQLVAPEIQVCLTSDSSSCMSPATTIYKEAVTVTIKPGLNAVVSQQQLLICNVDKFAAILPLDCFDSYSQPLQISKSGVYTVAAFAKPSSQANQALTLESAFVKSIVAVSIDSTPLLIPTPVVHISRTCSDSDAIELPSGASTQVFESSACVQVSKADIPKLKTQIQVGLDSQSQLTGGHYTHFLNQTGEYKFEFKSVSSGVSSNTVSAFTSTSSVFSLSIVVAEPSTLQTPAIMQVTFQAIKNPSFLEFGSLGYFYFHSTFTSQVAASLGIPVSRVDMSATTASNTVQGQFNANISILPEAISKFVPSTPKLSTKSLGQTLESMLQNPSSSLRTSHYGRYVVSSAVIQQGSTIPVKQKTTSVTTTKHESNSNGSNVGAIVGGVLGGVALLGLIGYILVMKKNRRNLLPDSVARMIRRRNDDSTSQEHGIVMEVTGVGQNNSDSV